MCGTFDVSIPHNCVGFKVHFPDPLAWNSTNRRGQMARALLRTPAPDLAANHEQRASSKTLIIATVIPTFLCVLVQFLESHSLRQKVVWITKRERESDPTGRLGSLLLGVTERGILDLVEHVPMEVR
jgi:hypothetical protein